MPARTNATVRLPASVAVPGDPTAELLVASADAPDTARAWWYFVEDLDLDLAPPALTTAVTRERRGYQVTVTAESFLKDLALFPDRLDPDAVVDDLLVTLLPGESHTFVVRSTQPLDPAALVDRPVLHSATHLAHPIGAHA